MGQDTKLPFADLPYRKCVGVMLLNQDNRVFVGRRADVQPDAWQMPQGGLGKKEDPIKGAFRELAEETGIRNAHLLAEVEEWLTYDLPPHLLGKAFRGKYRGQKQKWIVLRFTGQDQEVDLYRHKKAEFNAWRWVPMQALPQLIVPFKRPIYEQLVALFASRFPAIPENGGLSAIPAHGKQ
ncbi:MAG: RNA pyrophosphohydrolase [Magnetospiraceae bacterium]